MDFLGLAGKRIVVTGVANKKSVAWHIHKQLRECGAEVIHVVRSTARKEQLESALAPSPVYVCDVEDPKQVEQLGASLGAHAPIDGLVHSIAFANYSRGLRPFDETERADFLQAVDISCYSLIALARTLRPHFAHDASIVTISISSTTIAAESYGYMAPIKAALDSAVVFLAKSFSATSAVRVNAVKAGPLKTSASAGIPGYLDNYLYAEGATLRHAAVKTEEVASTALFLLSPRSSGINGQGLVVDAGMGFNFFDAELVRRFNRPQP